jgi:hypothetical protein
VSSSLIVELAIAVLNARPVNSGVMPALRIQFRKSPAAPLLHATEFVSIIRAAL